MTEDKGIIEDREVIVENYINTGVELFLGDDDVAKESGSNETETSTPSNNPTATEDTQREEEEQQDGGNTNSTAEENVQQEQDNASPSSVPSSEDQSSNDAISIYELVVADISKEDMEASAKLLDYIERTTMLASTQIKLLQEMYGISEEEKLRQAQDHIDASVANINEQLGKYAEEIYNEIISPTRETLSATTLIDEYRSIIMITSVTPSIKKKISLGDINAIEVSIRDVLADKNRASTLLYAPIMFNIGIAESVYYKGKITANEKNLIDGAKEFIQLLNALKILNVFEEDFYKFF